MGTRPQYNWEAIHLEYISGYFVTDPQTGFKERRYPTYQELSDKYGCNIQYLRTKGAREKWTEARKFYTAKFAEKHAVDQIKSLVSGTSQFDAQTVDKLKRLYRLIEAYLNQFSDVIDSEDGEAPTFDNLPEGVSKPTIREMMDLTKCMETCQTLMRKTVGEPVTNDQSFREFVNELNIASKEHLNKNLDVEEQLDNLTKRRESYTKASQNIQKEISRLKEEIGI